MKLDHQTILTLQQ